MHACVSRTVVGARIRALSSKKGSWGTTVVAIQKMFLSFGIAPGSGPMSGACELLELEDENEAEKVNG